MGKEIPEKKWKEDMEKEIKLNGKRKWRLENVNTTRYLMTSPDLEINFKLTFFRLAGAWNQKTKHIYIRTRRTLTPGLHLGLIRRLCQKVNS